MTLTVHGAIEMARGSDVISVRPEGDVIFVDMPSWRSAWSVWLFPCAVAGSVCL